MKSLTSWVCLMVLLLNGCAIFQANKETGFQGVTLPFYEKTTWAFEVFKTKAGAEFASDDARKFHQIHLQILKHMLDGNIQAYQTDSFRNAYSIEKLKSRGRMEAYAGESRDIEEQAFLEKFKEDIDQRRFFKYRVTQKWHWDERRSRGEVAWHGLTPVFEPKAAGQSLGKQPLAYLKYAEVADALSNKTLDTLNALLEKKMLQKLLAEKNAFRYSHKTILYNRPVEYRKKGEHTPEGELEKMFEHIQLKLYDSACEGRIKAYKNESLSETYSKEEVAKQGGKEAKAPHSPAKQQMGVKHKKSVFLPLNPDNLRKCGILEEWQAKSGGRYHVESRAFAPLKGKIGQADTANLEVLFWLKGDELEAALSGPQASWLRKYAFLTLQRKLTEVSGTIAK